MFNHPPAFTTIESTDPNEILKKLQQLQITSAHFTNGTFALAPRINIPTTLAAFKHALDNIDASLPLIIGINSDKSMLALGKKDFDKETKRAEDIANPVAATFPKNKVIVFFYDDTTPNAVYTLLSEHKLTRSLYKWGYGTDPKAPRIEGASLFETVSAHPLVDDLKPICWNETAHTEQPNVQVVDLRDILVTAERKCLFQLPASLNIYQGEIKLKASIDNTH